MLDWQAIRVGDLSLGGAFAPAGLGRDARSAAECLEVMRAIIRHPEILSGRWHFAGTSIPIAALLADYRHGRDATLEQYRFMHLTHDEIDAALAFTFPAVCDPSVELQYAAIMLRCECGEEMHTIVAWPGSADIVCVCGRGWRMPFSVERVPISPGADDH